MAIIHILCACLLTGVKPSIATNLPEVHEIIEDVEDGLLRTTRHSRTHPHQQQYQSPIFNYKETVQQDPRKIRYAQQQQVDTYLRAYQQSRRNSASFNTDDVKKKVVDDPKNIQTTGSNKLASDNNSRHRLLSSSSSDNTDQMQKNKKTTDVEKVSTHSKYDTDRILDQEIQASEQRRQEIVQYPVILSPNYLTKSTVLGGGTTRLTFDPDMLIHNLVPDYGAIQSVPESNLDALSSLIGKAPSIQLQGLNALIHQPLIEKDHTPITEEVIDYENPQTKPNIKVNYPQVNQIQEESNKNLYENLQYASQYAFGYKINDHHSGNNFGHEEIRKGDVAKGHYYVYLPDGRLQNVEYWTDPSGYHAKVTYH